MRTIYLDNAATPHPKPESVYQAVNQSFRQLGSSGRGAHKLAVAAAQVVFETRTAVADFLGAPSDRIIFTPGCTHGINMVLRGMRWKPGDKVLVSAMEHNAVMRPLELLKRNHGVEVVTLPYSAGEIVAPSALAESLERQHFKLCILIQSSNVTGESIAVAECAQICDRASVPLLLDAAQCGSRYPGILNAPGISFWVTSGHKAFYAPPGVGLLYVNPKTDLEAAVAGGTGSASEQLDMPTAYPDRLEPGTSAVPAIAGLGAGLEFLLGTGIEKVRAHEQSLTSQFLYWCQERASFVRIFNALESGERAPIVSFQIAGISPDRIADRLDTEYGIATRPGLHCAVQAHTTLGTKKEGTVRASFGFFNSANDVEQLCHALEHVASKSSRGTLV